MNWICRDGRNILRQEWEAFQEKRQGPGYKCNANIFNRET